MAGTGCACMQGEDPDQVIRNFVAKRREARAQPSLPTFQAKRTAQAAPKATAQPLQVQHPPSKGSASAMPSAVNAFPPPFQPSGKAVATKTALAPPPAPVVSSAPPPAPAVPTPPDRTFEDAEKWLRSSLNPQAGLQAIPQVWIGVTDLYVLAPLADNLEEHYLSKARFLLDFKVFPEYKVCCLISNVSGLVCYLAQVSVSSGLSLYPSQEKAARFVSSLQCICDYVIDQDVHAWTRSAGDRG